MTYNLRPRHLRVLSVKDEQALQAGKKLDGDRQTRTFKNGPKGYAGAAVNPWRIGKSQVRRWYKKLGEWHYSNDGTSDTAAGLAPYRNWDGEQSTPAKESKAHPHTLRFDDGEYHVVCPWEDAKLAKNPPMYYSLETLDEDSCVRQDWYPQALTRDGAVDSVAIARRTGWATKHNGGMYDPRTEDKAWAYEVKRDRKDLAVEWCWYEVEREEDFVPQTAEQREVALVEQTTAFGTINRKKVTYGEAACMAKGKWEKKEAAQDRMLRAAFAPRPKTASDVELSLDTRPIEDEEPGWTPTSDSPMEQLEAEGEERARRMLAAKVLASLTDKQRVAVELTMAGMSLTTTQRRHLQMAREKVAKRG